MLQNKAETKEYEDWLQETLACQTELFQEYESLQISRIDFLQFVNFCFLDLMKNSNQPVSQDSNQPHYFKFIQQNIHDLELTEERIIKTRAAFSNMVTQAFKTREELRKTESQILNMIRQKMPVQSLSDLGDIVSINAKLTEFQQQNKSLWSLWQITRQKHLELLTPTQRAIMLIRRTKFLENANILNTIWSSLNRQSQSVCFNPTSATTLPLPIQLTSSISGIIGDTAPIV